MGRKKIGQEEDGSRRFWRIMNTHLCEVSDEDLEWASKQELLNSYTSKCVWMYEIERRKDKNNKPCSIQKQQ